MSEMSDDAPVIVSESTVVSKFEGDEQHDGALVEKVYIENGVIVKNEFFENGELTRTTERRDD